MLLDVVAQKLAEAQPTLPPALLGAGHAWGCAYRSLEGLLWQLALKHIVLSLIASSVHGGRIRAFLCVGDEASPYFKVSLFPYYKQNNFVL